MLRQKERPQRQVDRWGFFKESFIEYNRGSIDPRLSLRTPV
jgi:hypothetical protein